MDDFLVLEIKDFTVPLLKEPLLKDHPGLCTGVDLAGFGFLGLLQY